MLEMKARGVSGLEGGLVLPEVCIPKAPWQSSLTIQQPEDAKVNWKAEGEGGAGEETFAPYTSGHWMDISPETSPSFPLMNAQTSSTGNAVRWGSL